MRSDLPAPREPCGGAQPGRGDSSGGQQADGPPAWPRERLAELRERLERLDSEHPAAGGYPQQPLAPDRGARPASPGKAQPREAPSGGEPSGGEPSGDAPPGEASSGDARGDDAHGGSRPDSTGAQPGEPGDRAGDPPRPGGTGGPGDAARPGRGAWSPFAASAVPAGALPGYRPWFSECAWAAPWFTGSLY